MMDQLSLVFFTVLAQMAVGLFISLGLFDLIGKPEARSLNKPLLVVWGVMAVGALASMTHLAQPLRMFNVLMGVSHGSALSLKLWLWRCLVVSALPSPECACLILHLGRRKSYCWQR